MSWTFFQGVEMGAGRCTVCWHRLDERGTGSDGVEAKMDAMIKWRRTKKADRNASPIACRLIHQQCVLSNRSMMCGIPYDYTAPVHEYVTNAAFAENSSETSGTDDKEKLNTWNVLLELLAMLGSSPAIKQSLGWHSRATLRWTSCTCPLCVVSRGATAETPKKHVMRDCAYLHQGVESRRATATRPASLREMCVRYVMGNWQ